jgi:hypothetical protein
MSKKRLANNTSKSWPKNIELNRKLDFFGSIVSLQLFLSFIALLHAWTLQFKSVDGNGNFISRISFTSQDPPWTPPGTISQPILHLHHFGDWTLALAFSKYANPYDPLLDLPAATPPLGMIILKAISPIGYTFSFILLCLFTLACWCFVVSKLLKHRSFLERNLILVLVVLMALPSIIAFDRGGVHLCLMGMIGVSFIAFKEKRYKRALIFLLIAVSFKPYLIILSLWIIRDLPSTTKHKVLSLAKAWAWIAILNLIAIMHFNSNLIVGVKQYLDSTSQFSSSFMIPWVTNSASLMGFLSKTVEGFSSTSEAIVFLEKWLPWSIFIGGVFLFIVLLGSLNHKTPRVIAIPLLLSTTSIVTPPAMGYTLVWVSLAMIIILSEMQNNELNLQKFSKLQRTSFFLILIALLINITPYFGMLHFGHIHFPSGVDRQHPASYIYIPLIFLATSFTFMSTLARTDENELKKKSGTKGKQ